MMRVTLTLAAALILSIATASAMKVTGNVSIVGSTKIELQSINGATILAVPLSKSGKFESAEVEIIPDVYLLKLGEISETVFLDGNDIAISGFLDPSNAENCQLEFTGIEANEYFWELNEQYKTSNRDIALLTKWIANGEVKPGTIAAIGIVNTPKTFEEAKAILDLIPATNNESYKQLSLLAVDLQKYALGSPAPAFSLTDETGKKVSLADFRGKYVVLDFWASWCGPCRKEIEEIKQFYPEFKDTDIVFISISLDDTEDKWKKGLDVVSIPWIKLWDSEGGGFKTTKFKELYGFIQIPFVMIVDKEGNQLERNIRGAELHKRLTQLK